MSLAGWTLVSPERQIEMLAQIEREAAGEVDDSFGLDVMLFGDEDDAVGHIFRKGDAAKNHYWNSSGVRRGVIRSPRNVHWASDRKFNGWIRKKSTRPCMPTLYSPGSITDVGEVVLTEYNLENVSPLVRVLGELLAVDELSVNDLDNFTYVARTMSYVSTLKAIVGMTDKFVTQLDILDRYAGDDDLPLELRQRIRDGSLRDAISDVQQKVGGLVKSTSADIQQKRDELEARLVAPLDVLDSMPRSYFTTFISYHISEDPKSRWDVEGAWEQINFVIRGGYNTDTYESTKGINTHIDDLMKRAAESEFECGLNRDEYVYLFAITEKLRRMNGDGEGKLQFLDSFLADNYVSESAGPYGELLVVGEDWLPVGAQVPQRYAEPNHILDAPQFQARKLYGGARVRKKKSRVNEEGDLAERISHSRQKWLGDISETEFRRLGRSLFRAGYMKKDIVALFKDPENSLVYEAEQRCPPKPDVISGLGKMKDQKRATDVKHLSVEQLKQDGMWDCLKPSHRAFINRDYNEHYLAQRAK